MIGKEIAQSSLIEDQEEFIQEIKVFPNPSKSGMFTLTTDQFNEEDCFVFDMQGKLLIKQKINKGETNLDLTNLAKGVYILTINGRYKRYSTKLVKI